MIKHRLIVKWWLLVCAVPANRQFMTDGGSAKLQGFALEHLLAILA